MRQIIFLIFFLSGCSYWKKYVENPWKQYVGHDCPAGKWMESGLDDGKRGLSLSKIAEYEQSCKRFEHKPDLASYKNGRDEGLKIYCEEASGHIEGLNNKIYKNVCPDNLESKFLFQYNLGREISSLTNEIQTVNREISKLRGDLAHELIAKEWKPDLKKKLDYYQKRRERLLKKISYLKPQAVKPTKSLLEKLMLQ